MRIETVGSHDPLSAIPTGSRRESRVDREDTMKSEVYRHASWLVVFLSGIFLPGFFPIVLGQTRFEPNGLRFAC